MSSLRKAPERGYFLCESGTHPEFEDTPAVTRLTLQTPDGKGTYTETWLCQACAERMAARMKEHTRIELNTARIRSGQTID